MESPALARILDQCADILSKAEVDSDDTELRELACQLAGVRDRLAAMVAKGDGTKEDVGMYCY